MKKLLTFFLTTLLAYAVGFDVGWAAEKTITLDYNSFGLTTSYALKTATVDGFGFTVNQGYKGTGNSIQMNSSKGSGILYNTTAIPGLKSIAVNVSSGNKTYTITTGTSQNPTANSQTGTTGGTYNAVSGDTYFQLKVSGASYFSSIVITYDDSGSTPEPTTYSITGTGTTTGGNVTASATSNIAQGTSVTITATPDTGYELTNLTVDGDNVTSSVSDNQYTFSMPDHDVAVSATFEEQSITPTSGEYVKVTSASDLTSGQYLIVYEDGNVAFDGGLTTLDAVSNTIGVTINSNTIPISATTTAAEFTIDTSAGTIKSASGKYIGRTGNTNGMNEDESTAYTNTLTYNNGNIDIVSSGGAYLRYNSASDNLRFRYFKSSSYTSQKAIQLYKRVEAAGDYTITVANGITNGTVQVSPTSSDGNENITVTATPATGYQLASLTFTPDGGTATTVTTGWTESNGVYSYTYTSYTTGDLEVGATFSPISYTLTRSSNSLTMGDVKITDASGSELSTQPTTVAYGETVYFKLFTEYGYQATSNPVTVTPATVTVSGPDANGVYSFTMPASAVTIAATFEAYTPDVYFLAGDLSNWDNGTKMTYDSDNQKYTLRVYFSDEYGYFRFRADNATYASGAEGEWWGLTGTTQGETVTLYEGSTKRYRVPAGIYDIEVGPISAQTTLTVTKIEPTLTFSPAAGTVEAGTTVSATSNLGTLIAAIDPNATVTVGVNTDNGSTWNADVTLNTVGTTTVYGKAYIGNLAVTGTATYNVERVNNSKTYRRTNTLTVGKKYIIVNEGASVGFKTGGSEESITISDHQTTLSNESTVIEFTLGGESGAYTFMSGSKYLQNPSGNTVNVAADDAKTWDVSIASYDATMKANATNYYLRYNSGASNNRFRAYNSSSTAAAVQLYEQVAQGDYSITVTNNDDTKGSVSVVDNANENDPITVTVTTLSGWACTGITVTPTATGVSAPTVTNNGDGTFSFTMPASDVTITPAYIEAIAITYVNKYIDDNGVEQTGNTGGTVTGPASAVEATSVVVTVTPVNGYQVQSLTYAWATGSQDIVGGGFTMPSTATTVTAVFEKKPFNIAVVSPNGQVSGIPATATMGTTVSFTITPVAGYAVTGVSGTWTDAENVEHSLTITESNGTYSFSMVPYDVTITVSYFSGDVYSLLTDITELATDGTTPYLLVGAASGTDFAATGSEVAVLSDVSSNIGTKTDATLVTSGTINGALMSTSAMRRVYFTPGSATGTYNIYIENNGYITAINDNKLKVDASASNAEDVTITITDGAATITQTTNTSRELQYNSGSPRFCFYTGSQQPVRIFKQANTNKVRPVSITGAAGQFIGLYNFIGTDDVTLTCGTDDVTIYYTTDGSDPTTSQTRVAYSDSFALPQTALGGTVTVKAYAVDNNSTLEDGDVVTATFTCIKPQKPTFGTNWDGESDVTFYNPMFIYPKRNTGDVDVKAYGAENIYFYRTLDGTTPAVIDANKVTDVKSGEYYIYLDKTVDLSVVKVINGIASEPAEGTLTFAVAAPEFSLAAGNYDGDQTTRLSTETKTTQNNVTWTTQMYYTFGNTEFSIDQETGEVTGGWTLYDATNEPYVTIEAPGTKTLRAVTVANYFNGKSEWHQSEVSQAVYVLTAANLSVTATPAPGTYTYTQHVTLEPKNAIGEVTILYDLTWDNPDANHVNVSTGTYSGPITIDRDATITILAEDSRDANAEGKTFTGEYVYKIGVQAPVFSPLPGNYYTGNNGDITVEMFSVSPNAKIYYTTDGSTPSKTNGTLYTGDIPLNTGTTYNFKAVAYVGNKESGVTTGTYTIGAKLTGNYWQNIKEMNEETVHTTQKTLANPVQIVYMSNWRNGSESGRENAPEFAFIRDNSGYGLIYFGSSNSVTTYDSYTMFQQGDWLAGGTITGHAANWSDSYINELGRGTINTSGTRGVVSTWPTTRLDNTAIVPETTSNQAISDGWTYEGAFPYVSGTTKTSDYAPYVDADKNLFGHYVHMRKNTISDVSIGKATSTPAKYIGIIKDETNVPLNYYDGLYLFSNFGNNKNYDQTFFDNIQNQGGTFDIYGMVYFYGPNAAEAKYSYAPYEIFPIDFEYTFPAVFHLGGTTYDEQTQEVTIHETKTLTLTCDKEGAQIWYKTSEMEDYEVYESPITVDASTTIETYSSYPSKYNDYLESKVYTLIVNLGEVPQPVISPESSLNAVGDPAINVTIGFESGVEVPEGITIYYTTDGSDPKTSDTREVYETGVTVLSFETTTTVRAIAFLDDFYSLEAEERTYTFVRSNGIIYTLVTSDAELDESSVYVVVNQAEAMSMQRTQKDNNRDAAPVLFVTNENKPAGHTFAGDLKEVYGNDDLAVFTMRPTGTGEWYFHTANGVNNASTGFLYGSVSGSTNQLKTNTADNPAGVQNINWTIEIDADGTAHMFNLYNDQPRYLRFNKSFGLYNTYSSESTGLPVYLYKRAATPLANIEMLGNKNASYTVADELVVVHAFENKLWVKDQGNVSIARREKPDGQIDYMRETAASGTTNGVTVLKQEGEWDQSNWAIIEFLNSDMTEDVVAGYKGKFIKPASLTGIYSDNLNYTIQVPATVSKNEVDAWIGDAAEYTPNVFSPSNFLDANLTDNGVTSTVNNVTYFFMNPKVQEVATITYAVWDGSKFVVPAKYNEVLNGADLPGAFTPEWTYNPGGKPELTVGEAYQFLAVMNRVPQGDGNGAPRKVNGKEGNADTNKVVMPLNLSGDGGNIVTAIDDVNTANREVVGVEYYNVAGQRSERPVEGVNIVVTRYSDGSTSTAKVLK